MMLSGLNWLPCAELDLYLIHLPLRVGGGIATAARIVQLPVASVSAYSGVVDKILAICGVRARDSST